MSNAGHTTGQLDNPRTRGGARACQCNRMTAQPTSVASTNVIPFPEDTNQYRITRIENLLDVLLGATLEEPRARLTRAPRPSPSPSGPPLPAERSLNVVPD